MNYKEIDSEKLQLMVDIADSCHWWFPYEKMVIICQKPRTYYDIEKRLHRDGNAAVEYPDGYKQWYLHGRSVPRWLAETTADELEVKKVIIIENVEIRAQGIKKIGIERVLSNGKVLSKMNGYMLTDLQKVLGTERSAPYLQMINPSTDEQHVEGVHPDCKTVEHALNWRAFGDITQKWEPIKLF